MRHRYLLPVKVWVLLAIGAIVLLSVVDFGDPGGIRTSCARAGGVAVVVPEHDEELDTYGTSTDGKHLTTAPLYPRIPDQYYCSVTGERGNVYSP